MNELLESGLGVDGAWPWLLLLPALAWSVRAVYRRTRPGVRSPVRRLLSVLRAAGLGLLVLLLAEPVISYLARRALRPRMITLVDTSPSMGVEEGGRTRLQRVREALTAELGTHLDAAPVLGFSTVPYTVSRDTVARIASGGQATDLSAALLGATETLDTLTSMGGIVLLSDGAHNLGEDPVAVAAGLGVPVIALGVGSEEPPADIQILSATVAGPALSGRPLLLRVVLRHWGYPEADVEVTVEEEAEELIRTRVQLGLDGQAMAASLRLPPLAPGPHILRVRTRSMEGELSRQNNQSLVFLRVRQGRLQVLLVAGGPGPDLAFLRRALREDSTLALTDLVRRDLRGFYGGGSFPPEAGLHGFDAVALVDPGAEVIDAEGAAQVDSFLRAGGGLLFIGGSRTFASWRPESPLARLLPVRTDPASRLVAPSQGLAMWPSGAGHPLFRALMRVSSPTVADPWQRLPPLAGRLSRVRPGPGATALLVSEGEPVLVAGRVGQGRVLAAMGAGFWRLDLLAAGVGEDPQRVRSLWRDATRWLATAAPGGRVRSSPERPVYRAGQSAAVAAEVYDELGEPMDEARVTVQLAPSGTRTAMEPVGAGRYRATWGGLAAGEYTYAVQADDDGQALGRSEGRFVVESYSVEASDLRANPQILAGIARASGGDYRPLERWQELADRLRPPPRMVRQEQRLGIDIAQPLWLWLIVSLLSAEWLIRKRSGML